MKPKKFLVRPEHGRVFRQVDAHTRVLVAIPGQEISVELAEECGLIERPKVIEEAPKPPPPKPKSSTTSYPTKVHKA